MLIVGRPEPTHLWASAPHVETESLKDSSEERHAADFPGNTPVGHRS